MGRTVIRPGFESAQPFSEGRACVAFKEIEYGYIDKTGKMVIHAQFQFAGSFAEGIAVIAINDQFGYIDKAGNYIWKPSN